MSEALYTSTPWLLIGCSKAHWNRQRASGKTPLPSKFGRKCMYSVAELTAWADAGFPTLEVWRAMQEQKLRIAK